MDITFGDVVYQPARDALEHGLNPDVEEVIENNRTGKIRECADNGHPHRREGAHGRWYCAICHADCNRPLPADGPGAYIGYGGTWIRDDYAVAEAIK